MPKLARASVRNVDVTAPRWLRGGLDPGDWTLLRSVGPKVGETTSSAFHGGVVTSLQSGFGLVAGGRSQISLEFQKEALFTAVCALAVDGFEVQIQAGAQAIAHPGPIAVAPIGKEQVHVRGE